MENHMRSVRIASRGSKLAMTQSNYIGGLICGVCPDAEITIVQISTKGDRDKSDFLYKTESVGFFTSEVEDAVLDGRADMAVHSLKDLPTAIREGLVVAAVMAYAGLNRLGMAEKISEVLDPVDFVPAPGQGALAV